MAIKKQLPAGGPLTEIRRRLRMNFVKNRAAGEVGAKLKVPIDQARRLIDARVPDGEVDDLAVEMKVGAIGDGGILKWIADHQEQILALVAAIVKIVLMFASKE